MKYTTTNLKFSPRDFYRVHERHIRDGLIGAWMATALLLIWTLLKPVEQPQPLTIVSEQQLRPAILVMTATAAPPLPTWTPQPTPEPQVIVQQAEPQVVYVPVEAAPTPLPETFPEVPPPPPADADQGPGGSGISAAPNFGAIPTPGGQQSSDYLWCAGAAAAGGGARCVGR